MLDFLDRFIRDNGYPPSVREAAGSLGLAGPNSVKKYLDILERKGFIRRRSGASRAIELINRAREDRQTRRVPLVGRIRAGEPILAVENIEDRIAVDVGLARADDMFLLRIDGDSMVDAHLLDGDLVLIRPQQTVEQGEIAAVLIGEEATVKYFYRDQGCIRLQPANPGYDPTTFRNNSSELQIIGKVTAVIRSLE